MNAPTAWPSDRLIEHIIGPSDKKLRGLPAHVKRAHQALWAREEEVAANFALRQFLTELFVGKAPIPAVSTDGEQVTLTCYDRFMPFMPSYETQEEALTAPNPYADRVFGDEKDARAPRVSGSTLLDWAGLCHWFVYAKSQGLKNAYKPHGRLKVRVLPVDQTTVFGDCLYLNGNDHASAATFSDWFVLKSTEGVGFKRPLPFYVPRKFTLTFPGPVPVMSQ